jgi:hypothetical protein
MSNDTNNILIAAFLKLFFHNLTFTKSGVYDRIASGHPKNMSGHPKKRVLLYKKHARALGKGPRM